MRPAMIEAEAAERREADRRASFTRAAIRHAGEIERRKADRRASDSAAVCEWLRAYDAARLGVKP